MFCEPSEWIKQLMPVNVALICTNLINLGEGPGLLRLHSTYRHDQKIYSSDEGRVQVNLSISSCNLVLSLIKVCRGP